MKVLFNKINYFLLGVVIFLLCAGIILMSYSKSEIHLFINKYHSTFWDILLKHYTNIGDGLVPVILSLILLLLSVRAGIVMAVSTTLAGLLSQVFKRLIFPDMVRPKIFFQHIADLYFVPGVEIHSYHSFPSGHTTTAFCMFLILAYFMPKKWLQVVFLLCAILVGYSRMYLSQHFLIDIYFATA